jgi:N utilization substance protein B
MTQKANKGSANDSTTPKQKPLSKKHLSRVLVMQALYQWQLTAQDTGLINGQFLLREEMKEADTAYFQAVFQQIPLHIDELNSTIEPASSRPFNLLDPIETSILWLACYELQYRLDIPYKVILNEAIDIAKAYGGEGAHTLINATLDKIAKSTRKLEIEAKKKQQKSQS